MYLPTAYVARGKCLSIRLSVYRGSTSARSSRGGGYPSQVQPGGYRMGVPQLGVPRTPLARSGQEVPQLGGTPAVGSGYPPAKVRMGVPRGYPARGVPGAPPLARSGYRVSSRGVPGTLPSHFRTRGTPAGGRGYPARDRTAHGVLDTPRSVSRRRTFLFIKMFAVLRKCFCPK